MIIKYINYIRPSDAEGLVSDVYSQVKRDFGKIVEPIALHSILPELLVSNWSALRETNIVEDRVERHTKDAIATAVSKINRCPWCVDAHTIMLDGLKSKKAARAIENQDLNLIENARLRSIVEWALANRSPDAEIINNPPFTIDEAPEIIGTAVYYHYINRMISVLAGKSPLPVEVSFLKGFMKAVAVLMFSTALKRHKEPGKSLKFIGDTDPDKDLFWASKNHRITLAFSSHKKVVEKLASKYIPLKAQDIVIKTLEDWVGEDPGISRSWVDRYTKNLDVSLRPIIRLSLLAAISPYQIDDTIIDSYRQFNQKDEALLATLSWASFIAAIRISKWLSKPFTPVLK
jgi:AhpD family alkylhydroperoxidase